ncbi:MAG: NUDIX hydrolase [Acidimicrobiales bacterium]
MRPGYGERHPDVAALLEASTAVMRAELAWGDGTLPIRVSAYPVVAMVPDEVVSSVWCIVIVGNRVVLCENTDGCHPWPGGRRDPGETYVEAACREVHEETGWLLDPDTIEPLGWLHLEYLTPQREDHPFPHPDFLQVVYVGRATERDCADGAEWTDMGGWEVRSRLVTLDEAISQTDPALCASPYLGLLRHRMTP